MLNIFNIMWLRHRFCACGRYKQKRHSENTAEVTFCLYATAYGAEQQSLTVRCTDSASGTGRVAGCRRQWVSAIAMPDRRSQKRARARMARFSNTVADLVYTHFCVY